VSSRAPSIMLAMRGILLIDCQFTGSACGMSGLLWLVRRSLTGSLLG
jgi:hypothetical protein